MLDVNKLKELFRTSFFFVAIFTASQAGVDAQAIEFNYDFHLGTLGWTAGFSEYPPGSDPDGSQYQLFAGQSYMPRRLTRYPKKGFFIQGNNGSAELFMYFKRRLGTEDGIVTKQTYRIEYVISFASNAPTGCFGPGSSPGEGVWLKAGASQIEPVSDLRFEGWPWPYLRINVDIGSQSQGGGAASVAGNIANGIPCVQGLLYSRYVLIQRSHQHTTNVTATKNGVLWLIVGTQSGFEGLTRLYYESIRVKLTPI